MFEHVWRRRRFFKEFDWKEFVSDPDNVTCSQCEKMYEAKDGDMNVFNCGHLIHGNCLDNYGCCPKCFLGIFFVDFVSPESLKKSYERPTEEQ